MSVHRLKVTKLDSRGLSQVLSSSEVTSELASFAERIAATAAGHSAVAASIARHGGEVEVERYVASGGRLRGTRTGYRVIVKALIARGIEAKYGVLMRAARSTGLEVKAK